MRAKILWIFPISLFLFFLAVPKVSAEKPTPVLSAFDTVANFETQIQAKNLEKGKREIIFHVINPHAKQVALKTVVDALGNARTTLPDTETHVSGTYHIFFENQHTSFRVFPGETIGDTLLAANISNVGGDPKLIAQTNVSARGFLIENIPATAKVNEALSFRVTAIDALSVRVPSYRGTITFSSNDPNAQLPTPYTFQISDQGRKTFDLGLTFRTAGSQKLTIQEQGNTFIKGEKTVEVVTSVSAMRGAASVNIVKPATGTYSVNRFEIAGTAAPNASVKIFNAGQQIGEVQSDGNGNFSYQTSLLSDGAHSFQVQSGGVSSPVVNVTIDTTPARVEQVDITTTNLSPGASTGISIRSDPDLSSVKATVGDFITDLEKDPQNPGLYRGDLTAPMREGEYPINVILTDKIGNVAQPTEIGKLRVDASFQETAAASFNVPSRVEGVSVIPGNSRVTLIWQPAKAESGIAFYRIYYGTDARKLQNVVNTKNAVTTWYIPNLRNGTTYYFQIVGVDTQGSEGDNRSDIVSAIPSPSATGFAPPLAPVLCDPSPCPPDIPYPLTTPQDGPGIVGMLLSAIAGGWMIKRRKILLKK